MPWSGTATEVNLVSGLGTGAGVKRMAGAVLALCLCLPCLSPAAAEDVLAHSLVKIFTLAQAPNYYEPWRVDAQKASSGSGSIIQGNRILTNAHVVSNSILIQVLKEGDSRKYVATKEFVAHDCDLAILKVEDPGFFRGTVPVELGGLPFKRDKVAVYGFPVGGDELSITEGVVSRIEISTYSHSRRQLLNVQTDAAINPGNSGGPVFQGRRMVGVAFQGMNAVTAQNTGYFVPVPIIQRFLEEVKLGRYRGVPALGVAVEGMENTSLRRYYGLRDGQPGILVTKVAYGSSAWGKIQEEDVLTSIAGYPIANDMTISFRPGERVDFDYPVNVRHVGDAIAVGLLRHKQALSVALVLKADVRLVPLPAYDQAPTYLIFDGLVFTPFNMNYPGINKDTYSELKTVFFHGLPTADRQQVVLLNHILPHAINKGYGPEFNLLMITRVNGHSISAMGDLPAAFKDPKGGLQVIEFDKPKEVGTTIALDAAGSAAASADILRQYNIPADRSADLAQEGR